LVAFSNAITHEDAVVVKSLYTVVTATAMAGHRRTHYAASTAVTRLKQSALRGGGSCDFGLFLDEFIILVIF